MNTHELEFDTFDTALSELLQGEEMPSVDFTARVMAQVKETTQEEKKTSRKVRPRYIATIAACAAVMVLCAPFLRMMFGMGSLPAEKADSAAPAPAPAAVEESMAADSAAPDGDSYFDYKATESEKGTGAMEARDVEAEAPGEPAGTVLATEDEKHTHDLDGGTNDSNRTLPVVILEPEVFEDASTWLLEQGYAYEDGYTLTAADVAALNAQFPDLELEEVDCVLQRG